MTNLADEIEALRSGIEDLTSDGAKCESCEHTPPDHWKACPLEATYWRSLVLGEKAHDLARRVRELEQKQRRDWRIPPCLICGYDGPNYYQPDVHMCAGVKHG